MACGGTFATGTWLLAAGQPVHAAPSFNATAEYDVVVCGAGTSGIPAAVAAAREGAKVAVVERYGCV
jgi:ribulose 1,5-bisphosphate synthetase/thiazole synthase